MRIIWAYNTYTFRHCEVLDMSNLMKQHGSYTLTCSKDTFLVKCFGSWNIETTRLYSLEYKATVAPLLEKNWAVVCDLRNWELATPESMSVFQELMTWCFENGLDTCVYVYEQSFIKKHNLEQMALRLVKLPENYNFIKMESLLNIHDWLRSHGHDVNVNDLMKLEELTEQRNSVKYYNLN